MSAWWPVAAELAAVEALSAEFPHWRITAGIGGMVWSAFWRSPDGRSRRVIVKGNAPELLSALRSAS